MAITVSFRPRELSRGLNDTVIALKPLTGDERFLYRNNLKNRFLTASAFSQNSHLRSRLGVAQWTLAPDENFEKPPCQIPDPSGCFGIDRRNFRRLHLF
jgi:hypothetical protein